jgi:hypothetical protein
MFIKVEMQFENAYDFCCVRRDRKTKGESDTRDVASRLIVRRIVFRLRGKGTWPLSRSFYGFLQTS